MRYATIHFSAREKRDIAKAWILTSLAFAIFFLRTGFINPRGLTGEGFLLVFGIAALTAGVGFVVHELCHKLTAHRFGIYGEFYSNGMMLIISIVLAFMGMLFAAPGGVYMQGHITRKQNGIISAAGPVSNMVLVFLFAPLLYAPGTLLPVIGKFGVLINAILGAFNLIPFLGLDGSKVLAWSKPVYFTLVTIAAFLVVGAYLI